MQVEAKKLLLDMLESCDGIDQHLGKRKIFRKYAQNRTARMAVDRELEIIGEAMNRLLKIEPDAPISYARVIVDLRNRLAHAYDAINIEIVWKIIVVDIPVLRREVAGLLEG